ncbi:hypothetical protein [uncultured Endozoicomonas sp.]|uniref:hypothetical protein n=1 Tax=uncultured Endozoicomonas sp. TaxID=432652 RepID=UPI0026280B1E|nr:hypothetical protein [uncultured Endozoicomonas sp.]
MSDNNEETMFQLLHSLMGKTPDHSLTDLLESAHKGFTHGANDFVEQAAGNMQPVEIKNNLRSYPLAQILVSIVKYHELNKDTDIIRETVLATLECLENNIQQTTDAAQTVETTLH